MDLFSKLQRPLATCFLIPLAEAVQRGAGKKVEKERCIGVWAINPLLRRIIRGGVSQFVHHVLEHQVAAFTFTHIQVAPC